MKKIFSPVRAGAWAMTSILAAGLLFASCKKSSNDNNNMPVSGLMAFNLSPDVSLGGFALSGNNLTASPLAFNNFTGSYLGIYPGSRSVEPYNFNTGATLTSVDFTFEPSKFYSVFLVGADSTYKNVIVNDNVDSLSTTTNQAFARYINAIPDASNPTVTIAVNGSNVVNDNAAFASVSEFTPVDAGSVTIHVTNGGTIEASRTITLEQRKVYTILLSGKPGGTGDNAVQIKYIVNGTVYASTSKASTVTTKAVN